MTKKINNLELTKATEIFLKHYENGTKNSVVEQIRGYNTHKIRHSIGVLEYGRLILLKMEDKIDKELKQKAEICFLLHDIARFYQNNGEKVLSNKIFEHGDAGYNLALKDNYPMEICLAIKYHNKKDLKDFYKDENYQKLDKEIQKQAEFLAKITRDADKLENMIYYTFNIDHFLLLGKEKNGDIKSNISKEVLKNFKKRNIVDKNNIKTIIDRILAMTSWIFDINFYETKKILKQNKFLKNIEKILKEKLDKKSLDYLEEIVEICKEELKKK